MKMQAPQIIYLVLMGIGFLFNVILDGKEKTGKHSLGAWFIDTIIVLGLLYWGGFFTK